MHCHAGKERTGVIAALLLTLAGVADEVIADDYVASDRYLGALYEERAAREPDPEERSRLLQGFKCKAEHILDAITYMRSLGGVEAYLREAVLAGDEVSALRRRISAG